MVLENRPPKIRVLVVDDHHLVREGIVAFLHEYDDLKVVGEAANGREAVEMTAKLAPDVVLMDLVMPEMDGVTAAREIHTQYPDVQIVVLSSFGEEEHLKAALRAGVAGYLLKDLSPDELARGIREAHRGETPLAPQVAKKLIEAARESRGEESAEIASLSAREREVLALLGQGLTNNEIAKELSISDKTVKFHVSNILSRLGLDDRTQAALFAVKHGIAPPK